MTGSEHYRQAEECIQFAQRSGDYPDVERIHLAYAQVHATLALAAATALHGSAESGQPMADDMAWRGVAASLPVS